MTGDPRSEVFSTVAWDGGMRLLAADLHFSRFQRHSERLGIILPENIPEIVFQSLAEIEIPGNDLKNIFPAMDFLTASNKKGLGDKVKKFDDGTLNAEGKNVIVIGGGDTAMDCVRTSVRQNAKSVKCLYRRDKELSLIHI